ncbi:alpha/beta fold hydrolase [Geodermatophilus sp. CPCC 206100]|uniref:alpha/beta fold hydrolase n=1 Tax=Geodermatophilus sp. CPCC 206100 TaxID=3020054 RepID=UPI003B004BE1
MAFFGGFRETTADGADGVRLRVRTGGAGPPVVLLHGHPRTHTTWHRVAPLLAAAGHTVVCPDLRGYGRSTAPPPSPGHGQAAKRAMARDVVALMTGLGHERFAVVGHDRARRTTRTSGARSPTPAPSAPVAALVPFLTT